MDAYTLITIALISCVPFACRACDFPDFLQSRRGGPIREWHIQHLEYHRGREHRYTHIVSFVGSVMTAEIKGDDHKKHSDHLRPKSFSRRCVLEIEPGQFLVTHNDENGSMQRYMCIEFLKRSGTVVQVKHSKLQDAQDPRLCADDGMQLNHWPMINKIDLFANYQPCPLEGGYFARFYNEQKHNGYCDVYEGETRLESECMKEEGMYFRFRYNKCIPDGLRMSANQRLFCMANWDHGDHTFVVLRHDTEDRQWCFRYPKRLPKKINAALFYDMVCDPDAPDVVGNSFLTVLFNRAPVQSASALCMDDYEGCSYWTKPCDTPGSAPHMTCARTCDVCNRTTPSTCTLPHHLWGQWLESNHYGQDILDIKDTSITKNKYEEFHCINWRASQHVNTVEHMKQMLVTTFDNGCKPRYTCAEFKMHAPSVLHYKLSISRVWPFYDTDWQNIDCSSFHYKDEPAPAKDAHRSRHMKALISMDSITNIKCGLDEPLEFTITVSRGVTCHGMLTSKDTSIYKENRLQLLLYDCPDMKAQQEFTCLESHRHGYVKRQTIITDSVDNTNEYQCWYFPVTPEHTFYQLPLMHCNEGAAAKITTGDVVPLITFKVKYTPTTTTTTTAKPSTSIAVDNIIELQNSENDWTVPDEYDYNNNEVELVVRSNEGHSHPDSYSHISDQVLPEGEMLVSPDSELQATGGQPGNKHGNPVDDPGASGNFACKTSMNIALLFAAFLFMTATH